MITGSTGESMPLLTTNDWLKQAHELCMFTDKKPATSADSVLGQAATNDCLSAVDFLAIRDIMESAERFDEDLALLLTTAFFELDKGSVCLRVNHDSLSPLARRICGSRKDDLVDCIVDELKLLRMGKGRWRDVIGISEDEFKPLILIENSGVEHLYFQRNMVNSLALQKRLGTLCDGPVVPLTEPEELVKILTAVLAEQPHPLNHRQRLAVGTAALQRFSIVSGGPGTGKTSIIVALLQCMIRCDIPLDQIKAVAPTGRAAQRMSESVRGLLGENVNELDKPLLDMSYQTLHSLLRYDPTRNGFRHNEDYPLAVKAVIVDEVSMVDVEMMAALLGALPEDARVIFLGDKDQLPSVEAGAVLADLIPVDSQFPITPGFQTQLQSLVGESALSLAVQDGDSAMKNRITVLDTSYRSEQSILTLARLVNEGDRGALLSMEKLSLQKLGLPFGEIGHGAFHCDCTTASRERVRKILDSWAVDHYLTATDVNWLELLAQASAMDLTDLTAPSDSVVAMLDDLFIHLVSAQILTLTRHGNHGVGGINSYLTARLKPICDPDCRGRYFHGEPILVQRNDRNWGLFNGDVGIVLRGADNHYRAIFKRMNTYVSLGLDLLPATNPAFAMTVHKSQGSEYGRVVLMMPPKEDSPLLCREILYTGITRAKNAVVMIGTEKVIAAAVSRKNHREGGMRLWGKDSSPSAEDDYGYDDLPLFQ
jgi:exodeoxyribonuclease V alpha subunit